jgi:hypothetical protein
MEKDKDAPPRLVSVRVLLARLLDLDIIANLRVIRREEKTLETFGLDKTFDLKDARATGVLTNLIQRNNDVIYSCNHHVSHLIGQTCAILNWVIRTQHRFDLFTISLVLSILERILEEEVWSCMIRAMGRIFPDKLYFPLPPRDIYGTKKYKGSRDSLGDGDKGATLLIRQIESIHENVERYFAVLSACLEDGDDAGDEEEEEEEEKQPDTIQG